ncbi:MAG: glutamine--fructose-6-phosphate transaminase (isomerizing) [Verrucomicrobiota bacterium]
MCGIVGYVGPRNVPEVLLNGLKRLEYRGYDSAGIATLGKKSIFLRKQEGKVDGLRESLKDLLTSHRDGKSSAGIAHTRWATHGPPTAANAHPHVDGSERLALVHNGIIENYRPIREHLESKGHTFRSDTDSEVLGALIADYLTEKPKGGLLDAVSLALQKVHGTYGIAVISQDEPGCLVVARRGSPIVIGVGIDEAIVASDPAAVVSVTQQVIFLDDNDVAKVTPTKVDIRNLENRPVRRSAHEVDWDPEAATKGGYEHFMLKEIFEQPEAVRNTIRGRLDPESGNALLSGLGLEPRDLVEISRILMLGCGTSLNAGMVGEFAVEEFAHLFSEVEQSAEFRYRNPIIQRGDLVLAISQSGETIDTLAALREAEQKGALVAALVNVVGSTIAREAGRGIYLHAGPEISVASTKAFTCQVATLLMVALKFGRSRRLNLVQGQRICRGIESIPDLIEQVLAKNDEIAKVAEAYAEMSHCFYIGRGYLFPVAMEGALKLKEISYLHAEGYHASELKHGPIALLQKDFPVIALLNDVPGKEKTIGNVHECRARHAPVIGVVTEGDAEAAGCIHHAISVPVCDPYIAPIPTTVALQLFAYHVARLRGCEIDQPRNLAKSVTVE